MFDNAPMMAPLSFATMHACNSSSSEGKTISSVAPPLLYLRIPSENTRRSVELSELQVPASGLGIVTFGFEDRRDETRLRDAAAGSSKCSAVATASVVIVGCGFGVGRGSQMEGRDRMSVQRVTSRASREHHTGSRTATLCHRQSHSSGPQDFLGQPFPTLCNGCSCRVSLRLLSSGYCH